MTREVTPRTGAPGGHQPVEVRLIGDDEAVRRLVAALAQAAACGPASYRASQHGDGTRAYLTVVVPPETAGGGS